MIIIPPVFSNNDTLIYKSIPLIVPLDNKKCAEGIGALLRNPELMQKLSENCSRHDYSNAAEIKKLEQIIDKDYENKNNNVS